MKLKVKFSNIHIGPQKVENTDMFKNLYTHSSNCSQVVALNNSKLLLVITFRKHDLNLQMKIVLFENGNSCSLSTSVENVCERIVGLLKVDDYLKHLCQCQSVCLCVDASELLREAYGSKIFHGLSKSCQDADFRMQLLCKTFSNLQFGVGDPLSPPFKNICYPYVKGTAPEGQGSNLICSPRSVMFAVLGWSGSRPTVTIEAYDSHIEKWFYIPQNSFVRRAYHGVVIIGVLIYVIGGFDGRMCYDTTFCFNVLKHRWSRKPSMRESRCYVTALAHQGQVYAMGGYDGDERFRSCERYDPRTNRWRFLANMHDRRSDASGCVHNGKLIICGGFNGIHVLMSAEMYDPHSNQWTFISNMNGPRSGHSVASHKGTVYVMGGFNGLQRLRSVEKFDELLNCWEPCTPLVSCRSNFSTAELEGQLYVVGGYNGDTTFPDVEVLNDEKNKWEKAPSLNMHRSALGVCVFSDVSNVILCSMWGFHKTRTANAEQPSPQ